ncbi:MAG TPA: TetR/AcrR family transcriptional regulator [bacterium]|nr:TetR/AcrR family transcriptional regulator [bacterium]
MSTKNEITAKRRKQIFEAAVKVMADKGFHDSTIKEIAREAGLGKGTIYQYIRKKEDLVTLIAEEGVLLLSQKIEEVSASADFPEQKLQSIIDVMLRLIQEHALLAKTMAVEIERFKSEDIGRIKDLFSQNILNAFASRIEEVMPGGYFAEGDALVLSDILVAMCFLWAHSDYVKKHAGDIESYKNILSNLFLYGLTRKKETGNG